MILYRRFLSICFLVFDVHGLLRQLADTGTFDSPEEPVVLKLTQEKGEEIWQGHMKEWLTFEVFDPQRPDRNFSIHLRHNRNVNVSQPVHVMRKGSIVPYYVPALRHVEFYQDADGFASVGITCELLKGGWKQFELEGVLQRGNQSYVIYPERISSDILDEHQFHKHVLRRINETEDFETDYIEADNVTILEAQAPHRPKRQGFKTYRVELLFVVDYAIYQFWYERIYANSNQARHDLTLQSIRQYLAFFLNGMDLRYKNIKESDFAINLLHAGIYIADTSNASSWTHGRTTPNPDKPERPLLDGIPALDALTSWIDSRSDLPTHDHALAFTGYDMTSEGKTSIAGLAYRDKVCTYQATSISENYFNFRGLIVAAHELGHNLGAAHDGDHNSCDTNHQYIMSSVSGLVNEATELNPWYFSNCSINYFRAHLSQLDSTGTNCLTTENPGYDPNYLDPYLSQEPGQFYGADNQCVYSVGEGSKICRQIYDSTGYGKICTGLYCLIPGSNSCSRILPSRGTSCGKNKWCMNGQCAYDPNAPAVSDSCPFGDEPGIITSGKTCSQLISSQSNACYTYSKPCCASCSTSENNQHTQNTSCQYGDTQSFCSTMHPGQCYQYATECCSTCPKYYDPDAEAGCEYGDLWGECVESDCSQYSDTVRSHCCRTCCEGCHSMGGFQSNQQMTGPSGNANPYPTTTMTTPRSSSVHSIQLSRHDHHCHIFLCSVVSVLSTIRII